MKVVMKLLSVAAMVALVFGPVWAQTQQPPPLPSPARPAPAAQAEIPREVQGTVKKVDTMAKSVQISRLFGLLGATVEVTDETKILIDNKEASLSSIREGDRVKAAYEFRDGKNVAKTIEVMPAEGKDKTSTPGGSPAGPAPPIGAGVMSPAGQPKTQ